ncbi:MAG: polysaccharide deacetylase family protein [Chloroflexi bacterium]|nr:polysaccharide deacetylase family protein [Chloroflexota bacterium]
MLRHHTPTERDRFGYSPLPERPPLRWPNGKQLALWVVPNLEYYEYLPPPNSIRNPFPRTAHPDVMQYSWRDYGNRVGIWRLADLLDRYPVRVTVSLNLAAVEHYPQLADLIRAHDWAVMSHGIYNTTLLADLTEEEERAFYADSVATVDRIFGRPLRGMLGPCVTNTPRTMDLMAEAGLVYHADWVLDDQPVPLRVRRGRLIAMPYNYDLNDAIAFEGHFDGEYWVELCRRHFDRLLAESVTSGRVMALPLHTYLVGQPHTIGYLRAVLDHLCGREEVWYCTADELAEYYLDRYYEAAFAQRARFEPAATEG